MSDSADRRQEGERWRPDRPGLLILFWRGVRRFLSGPLSTTFLRLSQRRAASLRITLGLLLGGVWLVYGAWVVFDQRPHAASPFAILIRGAANALCLIKDGVKCPYVEQSGDERVWLSQTSLVLLTVATLLFSFWSQLMAAFARAFRALGADHLVVTGSGDAAAILARNAARSHRAATVLVREQGSDDEISAFAAHGVELLVGAPEDSAVLRAAGVTSARGLIAVSASDAQNLAAATIARRARRVRATAERGDVLVRIDSFALRESLPRSTGLGAADVIALAQLEARDVLRQPELYARLDASAGFCLGILGWSETGAELAAATLRTLWAPGKAPPRAIVFCPDPQAAELEFHSRFAGFREAVDAYWRDTPESARPRVTFSAYDVATAREPWSLAEAGALTALAVVIDDDNERLHAAARLVSARGAQDVTPLFIRGSADGAAELVLAAGDARVCFFGGPNKMLSPDRLIAPALDRASAHVHNSYIETCVLAQHQGLYLASLRKGRFDRAAWRAVAAGGGEAGADIPEGAVEEAEQAFRAAKGESAFLRLRKQIARRVLFAGLFAPNPERPAQAPWRELNERYVMASRAQVDHVLLKLAVLGHPPPTAGAPALQAVAAPADISLVQCESEHDRWSTELFLAGWSLGPRDEAKKTHPDLMPYKDFSDPKTKAEAVKKDRDPWLVAPQLAAIAYPQWYVLKA